MTLHQLTFFCSLEAHLFSLDQASRGAMKIFGDHYKAYIFEYEPRDYRILLCWAHLVVTENALVYTFP